MNTNTTGIKCHQCNDEAKYEVATDLFGNNDEEFMLCPNHMRKMDEACKKDGVYFTCVGLPLQATIESDNFTWERRGVSQYYKSNNNVIGRVKRLNTNSWAFEINNAYDVNQWRQISTHDTCNQSKRACEEFFTS